MTNLPSRPWQRVGADLFQWRNGDYLVLVDYLSRYIEVCNLTSSTSAKQVIDRCKAVFARFRCPEVLISDNGPQFSSHELAQFAIDFDFKRVTSSPRYPCSNGEAERAVKTIKLLLANEGDFDKALLAYRWGGESRPRFPSHLDNYSHSGQTCSHLGRRMQT